MSDVSKTSAELISEAREWSGDYSSWGDNGLVDRLADALEAATRVPVQGEPNDDRTPEFEAIEQELFKHQPLLSMQDGSIRGCKCMDRVFVTKTEGWGTHLAEVFTRLSRATVPDAATEALRREAAVLELRNRYGQSNGTQTWIEFQGDPHFIVNQVLAALDGAPEPEVKP